MTNRIEELCSRPIAGITIPRDLTTQPITQAETMDCLLLTATLEKEHAGQIKQAMEAVACCKPETADLCKRNLAELCRLPELLREDPALPTDYLDLDDRQTEMAAACQELRCIAVLHPAQAEALNAAAAIMEEYWTPLTFDD